MDAISHNSSYSLTVNWKCCADSYMVGTALLIFGVGMYVMFVRSNTSSKEREAGFSDSKILTKVYIYCEWKSRGIKSIINIR